MKAKPVKLVYAQGYFPCSAAEATHVELNMPGPLSHRYIPVILRGSRKDTGCWTWNGDTEKPTLHPSILTEGYGFTDQLHRCHTWVNDGMAQFLPDCSHELAGQTVELLDITQHQPGDLEVNHAHPN